MVPSHVIWLALDTTNLAEEDEFQARGISNHGQRVTTLVASGAATTPTTRARATQPQL